VPVARWRSGKTTAHIKGPYAGDVHWGAGREATSMKLRPLAVAAFQQPAQPGHCTPACIDALTDWHTSQPCLLVLQPPRPARGPAPSAHPLGGTECPHSGHTIAKPCLPACRAAHPADQGQAYCRRDHQAVLLPRQLLWARPLLRADSPPQCPTLSRSGSTTVRAWTGVCTRCFQARRPHKLSAADHLTALSVSAWGPMKGSNGGSGSAQAGRLAAAATKCT
jgi:hypothetical protein